MPHNVGSGRGAIGNRLLPRFRTDRAICTEAETATSNVESGPGGVKSEGREGRRPGGIKA